MPDGLLPHPWYPSPPSSENPQIMEAVRSGRPEEIQGLSWTPPDFSAPGHRIIRTFSIESKQRAGREYIPCAICSGDHPKFLDGAVIWSPDGYLRLIGHKCAARPEHFGEAGYRSLRKRREQEELDNVALTWLAANIAALKTLADTVQQLRRCTIHLEEQQRLLFRDVRDLASILSNRARHHGGTSTVSVKVSGAKLMNQASGAIQSLYDDLAIGTMQGCEFLAKPRTLRSRRLEGNLGALALVPEGEGEQPLYALIDEGGEQKITIVAGAVFRALQLAAKLAEEYRESNRFFADENLAVLQKWGEDQRNTIQFVIRKNQKRIELCPPIAAVLPSRRIGLTSQT